MATVAEIIQQAFREGNFIAVGETPTPEEQAETIPRLRNLLSSLFGYEVGEQYRDWRVPAKFTPPSPLRAPFTPDGESNPSPSEMWKYPPPNSRLLVRTTQNLTVLFPVEPRDGARMQLINVGPDDTATITLDGNGRLIEDGGSVTDTLANLDGRKWFYRADLGNWIRIDTIDVLGDNDPTTETIPLPGEFDEVLICGLAMRLSVRFETKVDQETVRRYADVLSRLKKRYRQGEGVPSSFGELRSTVRHNSTFMDV